MIGRGRGGGAESQRFSSSGGRPVYGAVASQAAPPRHRAFSPRDTGPPSSRRPARRACSLAGRSVATKGDMMCRWMAWHGQDLLIEELLFKPEHGLIDQSLHSRKGAETTNGDGFGVGWYGTGEGPGVYRSISPAWSDPNLRHLASHIESPLFLAHVRATSGTAVQETNCHPYLHGRWLFVHNGLINEFRTLHRELVLAVDPSLFADIQGSTDSELLFHLALTDVLEDDTQ